MWRGYKRVVKPNQPKFAPEYLEKSLEIALQFLANKQAELKGQEQEQGQGTVR